MEQFQDNQHNIFENGSVWFRADFHLHTIKDKEFARIENENDFIKLFVARLVEEDIGIGVITNHNKFDDNEYKNIRTQAKRKNIMILPGTELSINDGANGIHCLIVFDEKTWLINNEDYINQFLTAAFEGIANRENENTRCKYNLDTVLDKLDEHRKQGRDSFIIFAHVEQKSGFFNELNGGRIQQLTSSDLFQTSVLGLQKIRTYEKLATYRQWFGAVLPAFVEGSDCKSIDQIGKASTQQNVEKKTFIKIGDFNFESLKYALIDKTHRVSDSKGQVSNSYIKSIQFIGGKLDSQIIYFSSELNNLIGIRGSGKSSILEILRYALGIQLTHSSADTEYKNDLITYILGSGGKVIVTVVDKQGIEFRIEKIYGQKETIFRNDTDELCDCSISAVFDIPIYFGQKDLSNKKEDFESDLLKRLIGNRLQTISRDIEEKKLEIINIIMELKTAQNIGELKEDTEKTIRDAEQKLVFFKENGIEKKLQTQTQFEQDYNILTQKRKSFTEYLNDLDELINNYSVLFSNPLKAASAINESIFEKANQAFQEAAKEFESIKILLNRSDSALQKFDEALTLLADKKLELAEEFAEIKRTLHSDTLNPDSFLELTRVVNTSKMKLQEIHIQIEKQKALRKNLLTALNQLNELWLNEYKILQEETEKINKSNNNLKIEIQFKGTKQYFIDKIKTIFRGTGIREALYQNITDDFRDFIEIYKDTEKVSKLLGNYKTVFDKRFNENLDELLTFRVKDKVSISYKGKPLSNHSLGQRASALILFLLAQKDNDILIIDQPEDDLDNQTIYDEVIKEILALKGQMQFIFATHNANIPVLGDSEKIMVCSFENTDQIIVHSGTIDTPSIQKSIIDIMEGGKEAFNKRKYIYTIWK